MTTRRGFLGAMLVACAAPAFVKASSLMPIYVPKIIIPSYATLWGDGVHDDQPALQALLAGGVVVDRRGQLIRPRNGTIYLPSGTYAVGASTRIDKQSVPMVMTDSRFEALPGFPENDPLIHVAHHEAKFSIGGCSLRVPAGAGFRYYGGGPR